MIRPKVSVIIPTHNRSEILAETLESVRAQTMPDFECIIVDDHSSDEQTRQIAKNYASDDHRFIAYSLPDSKYGPNYARNYGISLSQSDFISVLDSDDILTSKYLEMLIHEFLDNPKLDLVACRHQHFHTVPGDLLMQAKFALSENWLDIMFFSDTINGGPYSGCSPVWRKERFLQIGGWNESIKTWQDRELNIRALLAGVNIKFIDEVLIFIRVGNWKRMSNTVFLDRYEDLIESLLTARQYLIDAGELTELRVFNLSERLYHTVRHRFDQKGLFIGIFEWFRVSIRFALPFRQAILGFFLLLAREAGLGKLKNKLHQHFTAYRSSLPPPLPDLADPFVNLK